MWASERVRPAARTWAVLSCLFFLCAIPARADRLPLPAAEQAEVNRAIDQGVLFLKATQLPGGTWAADGNHPAGLAALPGLTLLECGVPPNDPAVRRAAAYVRASVPKLDQTYELALGVLFLDRLGDPRDEKLIQGMALRLVAGQSVTGGWGYKCPILSTPQNKELLLILRQINPNPAAGGAPASPASPAGGAPPGLAGKPAANPGPALAPAGRPPTPAPPSPVGRPSRDQASRGRRPWIPRRLPPDPRTNRPEKRRPPHRRARQSTSPPTRRPARRIVFCRSATPIQSVRIAGPGASSRKRSRRPPRPRRPSRPSRPRPSRASRPLSPPGPLLSRRKCAASPSYRTWPRSY